MANIKSQIKRNRQNETRRLRNKSIKSEIKTSIRKIREAADQGQPVEELVREAQKRIDKAASKGVLHPNTAGRRKARLVAELRRRGVEV